MADRRQAPAARALEGALLVATFAVLVALVVRLALQAARGVFSSDECFHAYAARWLLAHHALPVTFPAFYSGFEYYYHPMLHVLGAVWIGLLGLPALHQLPVAIHATLLAVLATGALGALPARAGRWAALLCATCLTLSAYAVRLYVDGLVALVFVIAVALVFRVRADARRRDVVLLGVVTAIALLTKFNGMLLPLLLAALAAIHALRREPERAGGFALACAIGVALALPWYARNQVLYGSALYPIGAPDLDRALYALNKARFSLTPGAFLGMLPALVGPWIGACAAVALVRAALRRRFALREGLVVSALAAMAAMSFVPMGAERHLTPMLAVLALSGAWAVHDAVRAHPAWRRTVEAVLIGAALFAVWTLPDQREAVDLPDELAQAFPHVAEHTPAYARILSLWTYDTAYYTGRAATWPNPWGQRDHPVDVFYDTDEDSLLAHLHRHGIDYLLVPMNAGVQVFDSADYPASFLRCLGALVRRDTTRLVWTSPALCLVRVAATGGPAARSPSGGGTETR